jgi:hypothetical protein
MSRTTTKITDFTAGMAADLRSSKGFARLQHFKPFPHKLVPEFNTKADENKSFGVTRFLYAPWLSKTSFALFGYGVTNTNRPAIYAIEDDIISNSWFQPGAGTGAGAVARDERVFFYYKGYFYGFAAGTSLWRYGKVDDTSGLAWTDTYQSITYVNVAQPLHHPADDCAYFAVDNKIYRLDNTTWNGLVLTLPDNLIITSLEADGDYLHIACKSQTGIGNSTSFQWDRDSSLETVTAKYDWGRGDLLHIANLQGTVIGVINVFMTTTYGHRIGKMVIKAIVGGVVKTIAEHVSSDFSYFDGNKFVTDDKLHFALELARDGGFIHGIFSVDAAGQLRVEVSEAEADGITEQIRYQGIYKTGEYWWIAHSNDGSVNRTDDQNNCTYTSVLETNIIGTPDVQSQFVGASVAFEPLPSGATVTLKCRKVSETNWTTIKAVTTTAETKLYATKDTNSQARSFYELQYRIESTGGAVITGLEWTHETNDQKPYGRS